MTDEPKSAADPRPNDEPYFVNSECRVCETPLVLWDDLHGDPDEEVWYDEWVCPECPEDTIVLDWPEGLVEEFVEEFDGVELEDLDGE